MAQLTPKEKEKIYLEEKARYEAREKLAAERKAGQEQESDKDVKRGCLGCLGFIVFIILLIWLISAIG